MRWKIILIFCFSILFINLISAEFEVGDISYFIEQNYKPSQNLDGWINISFNQESINSTFEDSFGNSIGLLEIINIDGNYNYVFNDSSNQTINSSFQRIYFKNANFTLPDEYGEYNYTLNFGSQMLFSVNITVEDVSLQNEIENLLEDNSNKIDDLKSDITKFNLFERESLNEILNISFFEETLLKLEEDYTNSSSTEEYQNVLDELNLLEILNKIEISTSANLINFYVSKGDIDLEFLKEIGGGNYDNEESYLDRVILWNQENLDTKITFKEFTANYGTYEESLLKTFEFSFEGSNKAFFVMDELENLKFKEDYSEEFKDGYVYIYLEDVLQDIVFSTTSDVSFTDIPVFISSSLGDLPSAGIGEYIDSSKQVKISRWVLFSLIIALLLIIGVVLYIVLQTWYKNKYEKYLFKDKNNLYNLIVYINNAKRKGLNEKEIVKNLRKAKWTNEQITYVVKKYLGKRTGMFELNFLKRFKNK